MGRKSIVLIGGGGHCRSTIEIIHQSKLFKIAGIVDLPENVGKEVVGYTIIASDQDSLSRKFDYFLVTAGQISSADLRIKLFSRLKSLDVRIPEFISKTAVVSDSAVIEEGTVVFNNATINSYARIGKNVILNTNSVIEHDAVIGDHCHISTSAVVNGGCSVGKGSFVGSNSTLIQEVRIGQNAVIGAGSVVTKSIADNLKYAGNPARRIDEDTDSNNR